MSCYKVPVKQEDGTVKMECFDIKDKTAREGLEEVTTKVNEVINTVNALSGVDGGHLATDEDINKLQTQVTELSTAISNLDSTYAKDEAVNTEVNRLDNRINGVDGAKANIDAWNLSADHIQAWRTKLGITEGGGGASVVNETITSVADLYTKLKTAIENKTYHKVYVKALRGIYCETNGFTSTGGALTSSAFEITAFVSNSLCEISEIEYKNTPEKDIILYFNRGYLDLKYYSSNDTYGAYFVPAPVSCSPGYLQFRTNNSLDMSSYFENNSFEFTLQTIGG